jgi:cytochrome c peroxidase
MDIKSLLRRGLLVPLAGLGIVLGAAADTAEIGPVPAVKFDKAKAALGKRLFFDKRLSGDAAISCATCHVPENGFAHPDALSPGYPGNGHFRNSPTLINAALKKVWLHDGRLGTNLNDVTREMITEDYIMNMDMRIMQERMKQDPVYVKMFKDAGMGEPSNGGARNAIPEFLKTLTSRNAPFETGKMSEPAKRGERLFRGKAGCISCHNGPLLSDGKFHNLGVPQNLDIFRDPENHQVFIAYSNFQGIPDYMNLKRDLGVFVQNKSVAGAEKRKGAFMTPTLRELKYTAPYMHNGTIGTLRAVVDFYDRGGGRDQHKDPALKPLKLSDGEKKDLVAFLEALSGDPLTGKEFVWSEPYPEEYPVIADWRKARN